MSNRQYQIDNSLAGQTLAGALRVLAGPLSWSDARQHIRARRTLVNGVICIDDARRLKAGDQVELREQSTKPLPGQTDIRIVHEDEDILVIDKPAGMECERNPRQRDWSAQKRRRQPTVVESLSDRGYTLFPVHRIDRDTSGLMVYALNATAQQKLIEAFASHTIERVYLAVGIGKVESQTVHNWIIRDRGDGLRGTLPQARENAQEAISHFTAIRELAGGKYTLLECRLETGRTHQIRLHLAEMGHPICGEKLYLKPRPEAQGIEDASKAPRHALHCHVLGFAHPISGQSMRSESPLPRDLERWLAALR